MPDDAPVAVVTGAGSGLGREITDALWAAGFRVVLVGRRRGPLAETAQAAGRDATTALVTPADVSSESDVVGVFRAATDTWGRVDLLVNNAGVFGPAGDPEEITAADWGATLAVNLTGSFLCAREAFRVMKAQRPQGGRIINNGSISAHNPRPGSVAYTASKHAVTGLTKSLSLDGRPHGIACGQIDIGNAATDMTAGIAHETRQANGSLRAEPTFDAAHAGEAVRWMAQLPPEANVPFMTLLATGMPYLGRG